MELTSADALALRMASLLLADRPGRSGGRPADVAGVVSWFGAMQAQDVASGMWSLGLRLPGSTTADVQAALERREALRTWPMRGTVHLVPPRDARWMLDLMGSRALAGATARRAHLGLTAALADRAVEVLGAALAGGGRLTRAQCLQALTEAGIDAAGQLGYHLLWYTSQSGVTCIGPNVGSEQTFVLLDDWAPNPHRPDRDEALAMIALRFFRSHGPATRADLARWTGLPAADCKRGVAAVGAELATVRVDDREMHLDAALLDTPATGSPDDIVALPGFDEYLLGYKDRSLMVDAEHMAKIVPGGNGVFQSTVVRGGRVVATWKRTLTKTRTAVAVHPLTRLARTERTRVEDAFKPYAHYTGRPLHLTWP